MALLNSTKPLEKLIPSPKEKYFESFMQRVPDHVVNETPIYAIVVNGSTKRITTVYQVAFVLFTSETTNYLFIGDLTKELTSGTYFISAKAKEGEKVKIDDWGFKKDKIGLHVVIDNIQRDRIYFSTSHYDVIDVRAGLMEEKKQDQHKVTLVTETVYV
jgi:hypothetical protein